MENLSTIREREQAALAVMDAGDPAYDQQRIRVAILGKVVQRDGGHWIWPGRMKNGSPCHRIGGRRDVMVRREIWEVCVGPLDSNSVNRVCDEERCVCPGADHLELQAAKGRPMRRDEHAANKIFNETRTLLAAASRLWGNGVKVTIAIGDDVVFPVER